MRNLLLSFFLVIGTNLVSQIPSSFNYQAVLRDNGGAVISNQNVSVSIAILQNSVDGTEVYTETHSVTTSEFGLINLQIGNGSDAVGDIDQIEWDQDVFFLKVAIDPDGGSDYVDFGTSQLVSVPYALYAKNSGNAKWMENDNNIYYNNGFVGIGNNDPQIPLAINFDNDEIAYATNTAMFSLRRTVNSSSASFNIYTYPDNDNLPEYMKRTIMLYATDDADNLRLFAKKNLQFNIGDWLHEDGQKMTLTEKGFLGLNENNPVAPISAIFDDNEIAYATNTAMVNLKRTVDGSTATFNIYTYPNNTNLPEYMRKTVMLYATDDADNLRLFAKKNLQFNVGDWLHEDGQKMVLTEEGNLGIGTMTPGSKLQVTDGDVYIENINKGIIMKSPNGQCWRVTIDDAGDFVKAAITCP